MTRFAAATKTVMVIRFCAGIGVLLCLSSCNLGVHIYRVAGDSMRPTLRPGDRIFVDEEAGVRTDLHDGDVIVLRRSKGFMIKRVLALPGETISADHRKIFRDGKPVDEPYLAPASDIEIEGMTTFPPRKVGAGEVFVMGDNREVSLDSRFKEYGHVKLSDVLGKYLWTYWHADSSSK